MAYLYKFENENTKARYNKGAIIDDIFIKSNDFSIL